MKSELYEQSPSTHVLAVVSLVLSVLGLVPILPVVGSIGGIISGRIARREIRESPELHRGAEIARAGIILGWVGVGLAILVGLVVLATLLFFVPVRTGSSASLGIVKPLVLFQSRLPLNPS